MIIRMNPEHLILLSLGVVFPKLLEICSGRSFHSG
jgi:hypothetical protein